LKRLDKALMELAETNEGIMGLSELDGFFTGLILCPEMIRPGLWLREVWGGDGEPEFRSMEAFQAALDLIMGHYNRVAQTLTKPHAYRPVMTEDPDTGGVLFRDWVEGFVRAVRLSPAGWQRLGESDDAEAVAAFRLLLEIPLIGTGAGDLDEARQTRLLEKAPDLIPALVLELNRFTKSLAMTDPPSASPFPANIPEAPGRAGRPGRNVPCPCGSGTKYKKCCGAN
jgi:uncharacterized protein